MPKGRGRQAEILASPKYSVSLLGCTAKFFETAFTIVPNRGYNIVSGKTIVSKSWVAQAESQESFNFRASMLHCMERIIVIVQTIILYHRAVLRKFLGSKIYFSKMPSYDEHIHLPKFSKLFNTSCGLQKPTIVLCRKRYLDSLGGHETCCMALFTLLNLSPDQQWHNFRISEWTGNPTNETLARGGIQSDLVYY